MSLKSFGIDLSHYGFDDEKDDDQSSLEEQRQEIESVYSLQEGPSFPMTMKASEAKEFLMRCSSEKSPQKLFPRPNNTKKVSNFTPTTKGREKERDFQKKKFEISEKENMATTSNLSSTKDTELISISGKSIVREIKNPDLKIEYLRREIQDRKNSQRNGRNLKEMKDDMLETANKRLKLQVDILKKEKLEMKKELEELRSHVVQERSNVKSEQVLRESTFNELSSALEKIRKLKNGNQDGNEGSVKNRMVLDMLKDWIYAAEVDEKGPETSKYLIFSRFQDFENLTESEVRNLKISNYDLIKDSILNNNTNHTQNVEQFDSESSNNDDNKNGNCFDQTMNSSFAKKLSFGFG